MLRLADRIANCNFPADFPFCDHNQANMQKDAIRKSTSVVVDDVALYYAESEQYEWAVSDFTSISPPFVYSFIEWESPTRVKFKGGYEADAPGQCGTFAVSIEIGKAPAGAREDLANYLARGCPQQAAKLLGFMVKSKWMLTLSPWVTIYQRPMSGAPAYLGANAMLFIDDQGAAIGWLFIGVKAAEVQLSLAWLHITLLAITFMNCKNVQQVDATKEHGPSDKWLRRQRAPKITYKTLKIDGLKKIIERLSDDETTDGQKKSLHLCRGNFATYTKEKPLFGHTTGLVWRPPHIKGNKENGEVVKDYEVVAG